MSEEKIVCRRHYLMILIVVMACLLVVSAGCSNQGDAPPPAEDVELELTLEELAAYNGKDGNPAYIAVDGVIYDVSNSQRWNDGEHNGYSAGQDLTEPIKNVSPHGVSMLSRVPVVGKIIE